MVKNTPANAGDKRDVGLIPGSGRPPGKGNGNPFHILGWEIPWTEEPGGLNSKGEFPNGELGRNHTSFYDLSWKSYGVTSGGLRQL